MVSRPKKLTWKTSKNLSTSLDNFIQPIYGPIMPKKILIKLIKKKYAIKSIKNIYF